jgi:hypothetical protein
MNRTITVYTDVEVDVDLSRFSTKTLIEELQERREKGQKVDVNLAGISSWLPNAEVPPLSSPESHPLHAVYYALKFGKPAHALDLMRDYVSDQLGVVL